MISLILQAIQSLMPANLCNRSQQLKMKKVILHDEGKPMANNFTNNRVWEFLGHTLSGPTGFSNFSSTKNSITSLKPRTLKNTQFFFRRNATFELKTNYCLFSHTQATQTSD